ncbi:MAG: AlwI family type II restriction endonuclease [Raineya sp.]|nr:AlwI family type II restriction endonuclease [Raineya sp.]MDW8295403.1 AlwI family type II restriction endonuclease [Raineya sp.]
MRSHQAKYKPLLFTTTLRNPERLKDFLSVLAEYENENLTDSLTEKIAKELIRKGLYQPTRVSEDIRKKWQNSEELTLQEAERVLAENPQKHKEAGFAKGWASRFDTWFKFAKELGLVYYAPSKKIIFSESGKMLLEREKPTNEILVFANAFAKYQRNNPFRKVLNQNRPLILLLQTILLLKNDKETAQTGISRKEILLLLCWKNDNAHELYLEIKKLRKNYGYLPSNEVILELCESLLDKIKRDEKSIINDYTDEFIRKMRLTGLITLRGAGRFIDINTYEQKVIDYLLQNYSQQIHFNSEKQYFEYLGSTDKALFEKFSFYEKKAQTHAPKLTQWLNYFSWEVIRAEMLLLAQNKSSKHEILRYIESALRLEFLTALSLLKKIPNLEIKPNFLTDDEGLPTCFAPANTPDIECYENHNPILIEVTLLTGVTQHIRESYSVQRHLESFLEKNPNTCSVFISPKAHIDTCRHAAYVKFQYGYEIRILNIDLFLTQLENCQTLHEVAFSKSSCENL